MKDDFLAEFIASAALARIMRVFLFDQATLFTLADMAKRAGISMKAAAREIKALEKMGIIKQGKARIEKTADTKAGAKKKARKKKPEVAWTIDPQFKYLRALSSFVHEVSPAEYDVVISVLKRSGKLAAVILSGSFMGDASRPVDLLIAVDAVNELRLEDAVKRLEPLLGREIRYAAFSTTEFRYRLTVQDRLIRDTLDFPHTILLDRAHLL